MEHKKTVNVCGLDIFSKSKEECLDEIFSRDKVHVVSGNPEVIYSSLNDNLLYKEFKSETSLIIPDGVGIKIAAKMKKENIQEKIAGVELMISIIERCVKENLSIYFLGASEESLTACITFLKFKYPNMSIAGRNNGYFKNASSVVDDIIKSEADVLFVALGCPKQEKFITDYFNNLNVKIFMGVGGSFDVIGGIKKRAPRFMINLGLEWLYRVILEPYRIKRLIVIPKFLYRSIRY